jgi:hypothetical protein
MIVGCAMVRTTVKIEVSVGRLKYLVAQGTFRSPVNICVQGGK